MKTRENWMPVGLSGIMDYSYVALGEYDVPTKNEETTIKVVIKEANKSRITYDVVASDNVPDKVMDNFLFLLGCLENCGAMNAKLIYHK